MDDVHSISTRAKMFDLPPLILTPEEEAGALAAARRDPRAFTPLYRAAVRPIYRYLYSRLGNAHDAEDLTSQVFIEALESLPRYRHQGRFLSWLFSIARHRLINFSRRRKPETDIENVEALAETGSDPSISLDMGDEIRRLMALIGELSDEEQELLQLRYAAELSFVQMAGILNRSEEAIKKQHYRLLERLQRRLEVEHE